MSFEVEIIREIRELDAAYAAAINARAKDDLSNVRGKIGVPLTLDSLDGTYAKIDMKDGGVLRGRIASNGDNVVSIQGPSGQIHMIVPLISGPTNYPVLQPAPGGGAVVIRADGTDSDISIRIGTKGAGYAALHENEILRCYGDKVMVDAPVQYRSFTVSTVPSAASYPRGQIHISNEAGGATPAFSDGVNWRRYADRAIIS